MRTLLFSLLTLLPAFSATIVEYNGANTSTDAIFIGQSVTTPGGGPWTDITFNLYDVNDAPSAFGTLFVLTQSYAGTPGDLSNATPGYLASTATINAGIWSFAPSLTLNANTQYFFYTDSLNNVLRANTTGTYTGGEAYYSISANSSFVTDPSSDTLFNLSGTPGATGVPEPATALSLAAGLSALLLLRRAGAR